MSLPTLASVLAGNLKLTASCGDWVDVGLGHAGATAETMRKFPRDRG